MATAGTVSSNVGGTTEESSQMTHDDFIASRGSTDDKTPTSTYIEDSHHDKDGNLLYNEVDVEPELHWRTWVAFLAVWMINFTYSQTTAGPPAVLGYIGSDLNATESQSWIANSASIANAVFSPILSVASDTFQARKSIMVAACILAFIGAAISPGSESLWRLIFGLFFQGIGVAIVSIVYTVPAEIMPRRWRPMAQASILAGSALSCMIAPLSLGALIKQNAHTGWRNWFWFQTALWGFSTIALLVGYRPPKRHTRYDNYSIWKKLITLDLLGFFLFTAGLTLLITGISLGAAQFPWTAVETLAPLIVGIVTLAGFGVWEWKGTSTGMIPHAIWGAGNHSGRRFVICSLLITFEGLLHFCVLVFTPTQSTLFTTDPVKVTARLVPYYTCAMIGAIMYGYISTRLRTIRWPMMVGFIMFSAGVGALISVRPGDSVKALIFEGLAGFGLGAPLALVVAGVQLAVPYQVLATATALIASARAIGIAVFTAIFTVAFNRSMTSSIAKWIPRAAVLAGVPGPSIPDFVKAIANHDPNVASIPGVTAAMVQAGILADKNALADALQVVFAIAMPFGVISAVMAYWLGSYKETMNYVVEAPVEELHAKRRGEKHLA
ncbi:hypothetical protein H2200_008749 [Cladophialophora chaetospira]|uniref:Major facilitator superfamily (MFS) profile domain-containing protein n=1 Tax=Cladophialophora chaetospira TaxID=386627 RepID=A0AA38X523_9EURO|nr:hypothetical protein H2200_008749 [Cladophialophora chaetospira]